MSFKNRAVLFLATLVLSGGALAMDHPDTSDFDVSKCTFLRQGEYYKVEKDQTVCFGSPNLSAKILNAESNSVNYLVSSFDDSDAVVLTPSNAVKAEHFFKVSAPESFIASRFDDVVVVMDLSQFPAGIFVPKERHITSRMARVPPSVVAAAGGAGGAAANAGTTPQHIANAAVGGVVGGATGVLVTTVAGPVVGSAAGSYVGGVFTNALNAATANNQLSHGNGMSALGSAGSCSGSCHG